MVLILNFETHSSLHPSLKHGIGREKKRLVVPPSLRHNQLDRTAVSNLGRWCNYRFALFLDHFLITLISIYGPTDTALFPLTPWHCITLSRWELLAVFPVITFIHWAASRPEQRVAEHFHGKHFVLCNTSLHSLALFINVSEKCYFCHMCAPQSPSDAQ